LKSEKRKKERKEGRNEEMKKGRREKIKKERKKERKKGRNEGRKEERKKGEMGKEGEGGKGGRKKIQRLYVYNKDKGNFTAPTQILLIGMVMVKVSLFEKSEIYLHPI
jgi:hypothetical protein